MDKAWLQLSRFSEQYRDGARNFVELARENLCSEMIGCPCVKCRNLKHHHYEIVYEHLVIKGMDPTYTVWVFHGERTCELNSVDVEMPESRKMFRDFYVQHDVDLDNPVDGRDEEMQSLVDDAEISLYPGCTTFTKMSASIAMFKHKARHGLSDSGFDELINLVRDMLPENNTLPNSFYEMKKLVNTFDFDYEKIYDCLNDCCLYRNEFEHAELCSKCGCSRWKVNQRTKKIQKKNSNKSLTKFCRMRSNQKLLHTMGRKGYQRMTHNLKKKYPDIKRLRTRLLTHGHFRRDEKPINEAVVETLKKIEDCAKSISDTPAKDSIRDDAVARILGPERCGRVRGLGFGVTPSKVDGQIQIYSRVRELESQIQTHSERVGALEEKVEALLKLSQNKNKNIDDKSSRAFTPESQQGSSIQGGTTRVENSRCQLLHWYRYDEEEIVAEGKIVSTNPSAKVHHMPLGRDCWKVWVEEVYMGHLTLYRPTDEFRVLNEAMRSTVAWPKSSIKLI